MKQKSKEFLNILKIVQQIRGNSEEEKEACLKVVGKVTLLSVLVDKRTLSIAAFILVI